MSSSLTTSITELRSFTPHSMRKTTFSWHLCFESHGISARTLAQLCLRALALFWAHWAVGLRFIQNHAWHHICCSWAFLNVCWSHSWRHPRRSSFRRAGSTMTPTTSPTARASHAGEGPGFRDTGQDSMLWLSVEIITFLHFCSTSKILVSPETIKGHHHHHEIFNLGISQPYEFAPNLKVFWVLSVWYVWKKWIHGNLHTGGPNYKCGMHDMINILFTVQEQPNNKLLQPISFLCRASPRLFCNSLTRDLQDTRPTQRQLQLDKRPRTRSKRNFCLRSHTAFLKWDALHCCFLCCLISNLESLVSLPPSNTIFSFLHCSYAVPKLGALLNTIYWMFSLFSARNEKETTKRNHNISITDKQQRTKSTKLQHEVS